MKVKINYPVISTTTIEVELTEAEYDELKEKNLDEQAKYIMDLNDRQFTPQMTNQMLIVFALDTGNAGIESVSKPVAKSVAKNEPLPGEPANKPGAPRGRHERVYYENLGGKKGWKGTFDWYLIDKPEDYKEKVMYGQTKEELRWGIEEFVRSGGFD